MLPSSPENFTFAANLQSRYAGTLILLARLICLNFLELGYIYLVSQSVSQSFWHRQKNCDIICATRNIDPNSLQTPSHSPLGQVMLFKFLWTPKYAEGLFFPTNLMPLFFLSLLPDRENLPLYGKAYLSCVLLHTQRRLFLPQKEIASKEILGGKWEPEIFTTLFSVKCKWLHLVVTMTSHCVQGEVKRSQLTSLCEY